jgi:hypothetical protein
MNLGVVITGSFIWEIDYKEKKMKLTPPKVITWWIAVILGVLGLLGHLITIPFVSTYAIWFVIVGLALLALASMIKGL